MSRRDRPQDPADEGAAEQGAAADAAPTTRRDALAAERARPSRRRGADSGDVLPPDWFGREGSDEGRPSLEWRLQQYPSRQRPRRRRLRALWVTLIVIAVVVAGSGAGYLAFRPQVDAVIASFGPDDYTGSGTGHTTITIADGDTGADVAAALHKAGVVKTSNAFYRLLLDTSPAPVFQPGVYRLRMRMSSAAALKLLQNPASKVSTRVVIPEGTAEKNVIRRASKATGIPVAKFDAAAADPASFGLPPQAKSLEGFLFPATYTFDPGVSARAVLTTMVHRAFQALDDAGVPKSERWKTVVLASVVQREAGPVASDFGKIARVFVNRLQRGMPLQSDATVTYGTGRVDTVWTTEKERQDASNPYNTYVHTGLPPGPIGAPGDVAIAAALHPTPGSWLYFVTVDLRTGKTVFSTTYAQHQAAVAKLQAWCRASKENSAYCN